MYLSLLGNSSLWSVTSNESSLCKIGRVEAGRCIVRTSLYKYILFFSRLYVFIVAGDYDTPYIAALNTALDSEYPSTLNNYIYRSTVTLRDNKAYGAGEICIYSQPSAKVWKGEGSSDSTQVAFNAYPSLESSLGLDGDWSLTSDGYFALG